MMRAQRWRAAHQFHEIILMDIIWLLIGQCVNVKSAVTLTDHQVDSHNKTKVSAVTAHTDVSTSRCHAPRCPPVQSVYRSGVSGTMSTGVYTEAELGT